MVMGLLSFRFINLSSSSLPFLFPFPVLSYPFFLPFSPPFLPSPFSLSPFFYYPQDADIDTRSEYYKHIVLSGGSSMYPGLPSRLEKDIRARYQAEVLTCDGGVLGVLCVVLCIVLCVACCVGVWSVEFVV